MSDTDVVFVDTETTGLHPDRHEVWEVGLAKPGVDSGWRWLLPVERLANADPIALSIGRFHERHPQGNAHRFSPETLEPGGSRLTQLRNFATSFASLTHGLHLAGAVVSFDEERLRRLLLANGVVPSWHYHLIDVEALAAGFLAALDHEAAEAFGGDAAERHAANLKIARPPWNSNELSLAVGVNPEDFDRHTALGDARWAAAIYQAVMA